MKRLLFVDDDPFVLDGLRRVLHGMRGEWEMKFVDNAAQALQELDRSTYDAIVSDMRMPTMDGAQLLEEVESRHSDIVRIILSGQCDKEAILRSLVPTHQLLSKPCDVEELKMRLSLAFAMRDAVSSKSLKSIIGNLRSVPSLPHMYNELSLALRSEDSSLATIENIIKRDVAMTTKTLQLANSAFIGTHGEVSSVQRAVSLIGTDAIRTLALSVHVFSQFGDNPVVMRFLPALWEHSVKVATLARRIALAEGQPRAMVEQCFTAGLLHDLGKVVFLATMWEEYSRILEGCDNSPACAISQEVEMLGCTHAQVGAYLMSVWGLPASLVHAVALHHCPADDLQNRFSPLTAVHCADGIANGEDASALIRDGELDRAYLTRLGLTEEEAHWRNLFDQSTAALDKGERRVQQDSVCR